MAKSQKPGIQITDGIITSCCKFLIGFFVKFGMLVLLKITTFKLS
jgi:hypothetical protein